MSPPPNHVPRTPDRRSSAQTLFTAFRSLTGGRLKSPTPPPSTSSATGTPVRTPSLVSEISNSNPATAPPHVADGNLRRISHISQKHAHPVTGGPPELDDYVAQLDRSRPFSERATAVDKICSVLNEYPVRNILGLWSVASDLLLPEQSEIVAEAGYKLLKSCASLSQLTTVERNVFFHAVFLRKTDRSFGRRLDIVTALTNGGRDIEACESSIVPFISSSLDSCFSASQDAVNSNRKANGKRSVDHPAEEVDNLTRLFSFITDICKFNARILTDEDLELLLGQAMTICQETTQACDMENCIKLFVTVLTYVHIPAKALRPCLEVLCAIHKQVAVLQEQTWNALSILFKSHIGGAAISSLLHTLLHGPTRKDRRYSYYRSTVQVLQILLHENGRNELPKVPMSMLFPALKASIKEPHQTQEDIVIDLINSLLAEDSLRQTLLWETDPSDLIDIVATCAERDDDRHRAKTLASNPSSLSMAKVSSERSDASQDTVSHSNGEPNLWNQKTVC